MSELRNRSQITDDEEHEVLIEPTGEDDEIKKTGKSGVAGDERNILVLLFLYILQVKTSFLKRVDCMFLNCRVYPWAWQQLSP